jgi:hypothetical protein
LKKLKEAGFHVVHVVPAPSHRIEIAGQRDEAPPEGYLGGSLTVTRMAE